MAELRVKAEVWPLREVFAISRGARTEAKVVTVELSRDGVTGRGECVPYAHYGEDVEGVMAAIEDLAAPLAAGLDRAGLQDRLPPGAARNAVDCALWDLQAKSEGRPAWAIAGCDRPQPLVTAYTLGLDRPEAMAAAAKTHRDRPLLKLKFDGQQDLERLRAIRQAAPDPKLIVDANEAWSADWLVEFGPELAALRVDLVEQPLPAAADEALREIDSPVPLCADESCHVAGDLPRLKGLYDFVNVKLDKTGGLTAALELAAQAQAAGFGLMVGCMIGTSLGMAPASIVAAKAAFVDLDGPLLLARDREPGIVYDGSRMAPPPADLWG